MPCDFVLPEDADRQAAELWLRQLYRDFGLGFHLDTPAQDYVDSSGNTLTGQDCQDLNRSIERLFKLLPDPYAVACDEMQKMMMS